MKIRQMLFVPLVALFVITAGAQNPAKVEKPHVKVGDRWVYVKIDLWNNAKQYVSSSEITAISENEIRTRWKILESLSKVSVGTSAAYVYDSQWNLLSQEPNIESRRNRRFTPPYQNYVFPLELGKSWEARVKHPNRDGDGEVTQDFRSTVVGWESITVPAGTFNALKITTRGSYTTVRPPFSTISGTNEWIIWYAPEVKRLIKFEYEDASGGRLWNREKIELVEYNLN